MSRQVSRNKAHCKQTTALNIFVSIVLRNFVLIIYTEHTYFIHYRLTVHTYETGKIRKFHFFFIRRFYDRN